MASSSPEDRKWHFMDLHGFKDFVVSVYLQAPNFIYKDWRPPEDQMTLDRAFDGLRYGLRLAAEEKGESALLETCRKLVEEAHEEYRSGHDRAGMLKLQEMEKLLLTLPTE
jgi:hypothetical protein